MMRYLTVEGIDEVMIPPEHHRGGFKIMTAYGGKVGDSCLVGIPKQSDGSPVPVLEGAKAIPLSSVYKMIEDA